MHDEKKTLQTKAESSFFEPQGALYLKHNYAYFYDIVTQLNPKSTVDQNLCIKGIICFSGLINLDLKFFNRTGNPFVPGSVIGTGERPLFSFYQPQVIGSINNADLFIDVALGEWVSAHVDLAYVNASVKSKAYTEKDDDWATVYESAAALKVNLLYLLECPEFRYNTDLI